MLAFPIEIGKAKEQVKMIHKHQHISHNRMKQFPLNSLHLSTGKCTRQHLIINSYLSSLLYCSCSYSIALKACLED